MAFRKFVRSKGILTGKSNPRSRMKHVSRGPGYGKKRINVMGSVKKFGFGH